MSLFRSVLCRRHLDLRVSSGGKRVDVVSRTRKENCEPGDTVVAFHMTNSDVITVTSTVKFRYFNLHYSLSLFNTLSL